MQPPYLYTYPYFPPLYDSRVVPQQQPPQPVESEAAPPLQPVVISPPPSCPCSVGCLETPPLSDDELNRLSCASSGEADVKFKRLTVDDDLSTEGLVHFNSRLNRTYRSRWLFRKAIPISLTPQDDYILAVVSVGDQHSKIYPWWSSNSEDLPPPASSTESMKMLIIGETDPTFVFQLDCDNKMFARLKAEQNLHVSFQEFTKKIIDLLITISSSKKPKIDFDEPPSEFLGDQENIDAVNRSSSMSCFLASLKLSDDGDFGILNIVEATPFRSLTHLSLNLKRLNCCESKRLLAGEMILRICYSRFLQTQFKIASLSWDRAVAEKQNALHQLHLTKEALNQQLADLQETTDQQKQTLVQEWESLNRSLHEENMDLKRDLDIVVSERSSLTEQVTYLKKKESLCIEMQLLNANLETDRVRLEHENAELKIIAEREKEASRILEGLADERAEYARMRQEVGGLRHEAEEKSEQLNTLKIKFKDVTAKLKESERTVESLQSQFDETRQGLDELRDTFTTRNDELKSKEKDYQRLSDLNNALHQDCQRLHQTNVELNKRLTEALVRMAKRDQPEHFVPEPSSGGVEDILFPEAPSVSRCGPPKSAVVEGGKLDFSFAPRRKGSVGTVPVTAFTIRRPRKSSLGGGPQG